MRVTLVDRPSRTGIGTYVEGLKENLAGQVEFHVRNVRKREWHVLGRKVGGSLSPWLMHLDAPIPACDLVHATSSLSLHKASHVATVHDLNPLHAEGMPVDRAAYRLLGRRLRRLRAVVTVSGPVRDEVTAYYRLDPGRVHVVSPGIDHATMKPGPAPPLPWGGPTALYVGDLRPYKGILPLVEAVARIEGLHLARIGPASFDAFSRAALATAARRLGPRFHDLGYVERTALRDLYRAADVLAFPSRLEGFGLPPLEAAACGTPSVVLDNRLNRANLGEACHACADQGPAAIEAALRSALAAPVPVADLVRAAAPFTWERAARGTLAVYRQALA